MLHDYKSFLLDATVLAADPSHQRRRHVNCHGDGLFVPVTLRMKRDHLFPGFKRLQLSIVCLQLRTDVAQLPG